VLSAVIFVQIVWTIHQLLVQMHKGQTKVHNSTRFWDRLVNTPITSIVRPVIVRNRQILLHMDVQNALKNMTPSLERGKESFSWIGDEAP